MNCTIAPYSSNPNISYTVSRRNSPCLPWAGWLSWSDSVNNYQNGALLKSPFLFLSSVNWFSWHPIVNFDRTPHKIMHNILYHRHFTIVRCLYQTARTPHIVSTHFHFIKSKCWQRAVSVRYRRATARYKLLFSSRLKHICAVCCQNYN